MSTLDALFLAGGMLHANATAADHVINAGLYYGPGLAVAAGLLSAHRAWQRACDWRHDRAARRHYAAVAFRLNRVADRAEVVLDQDKDELLTHLEAQYNAPARASKEDR